MEIKDIIQMVLIILGSGIALGFVEFLIKRKDEYQDKKEEKEDTTKRLFFFYRQESGSSIVWNVINSPYVVIEDPAG